MGDFKGPILDGCIDEDVTLDIIVPDAFAEYEDFMQREDYWKEKCGEEGYKTMLIIYEKSLGIINS